MMADDTVFVGRKAELQLWADVLAVWNLVKKVDDGET